MSVLSKYNNDIDTALEWNCGRKNESKSFTCPTEERYIHYPGEGDQNKQMYYSHYAGNYYLGGIINTDGSHKFGHKLSSIVSSSQVMIYGEIHEWKGYYMSQWSNISTRHGAPRGLGINARYGIYPQGKSNFAFSDLHVETMSGKKFAERQDTINTVRSYNDGTGGTENVDVNNKVFTVGFKL